MKRLAQRLFVVSVVLLAAYLSSRFPQPDRPVPSADSSREIASSKSPAAAEVFEPANSPVARQAETATPTKQPSSSGGLLARNVTLRDLSGKKVFQGDIDLSATIDRIDAGRKLSFPNDGSIFQNRERRLPKRSSGYYREWVHPTPELPGPGPQRVVTGKDGEAWYTPDHYRTFRQIR